MDTSSYRRTRLSLQSLAEHLLAADLHRHTGRIGLRATPGGFGQPEFLLDGVRRRLRIDRARLAVTTGDTETWHHPTTLAEAGEMADTVLGAPAGVYTAETPLAPEAELGIDPGAARRIGDWFSLVQEALEELRRSNASLSPAIVQLWPEHFDLATHMSEVNFGGSPGDAHIDGPYLYVGPWAPREGDFWNESFGATRRSSEIGGPGDALDFFVEGLGRALG